MIPKKVGTGFSEVIMLNEAVRITIRFIAKRIVI
jgi:hypothetical protein